MRRAAQTVLVIAFLSTVSSAQIDKEKSLSEPQVQAVIQAIEDEIYDYSYQGKFADIGESVAAHDSTRVPAYFKPALEAGEGWVIYKLAPYGEVIRSFYINGDGTATLEGDPEIGFPATQPNMLTIYMDDEKVCHLRGAWSKNYFEVMFHPSAERIHEAGERQKKRVGFSALLAGPALLFATKTGPELYRNEEFGIAVSAPTGALLCPTLENEHDHGPIFILGPAQAKACDDVEGNRTIVVFAGYNAAEVSKRLDDFLKWICANVANGHCRPAPSGLQITGLPSKAARVNHSDGWIDIIVVTQAGKPDPNFDASVPLINYDLRLHTKARFLDEDLRIFRAVLATIRLSPDQTTPKEKSPPEQPRD